MSNILAEKKGGKTFREMKPTYVRTRQIDQLFNRAWPAGQATLEDMRIYPSS